MVHFALSEEVGTMATDWSYSVTFRCAYSSVFHISQTVLMELGHNGSLWIGTNKALIDILAVYSVGNVWIWCTFQETS